MTKPNFILKRLKLLFNSDDKIEKQNVYNSYIKKRNEQKEKMCYCGHTFDCDCGNPSLEEFEHNLINNHIEEKYL